MLRPPPTPAPVPSTPFPLPLAPSSSLLLRTPPPKRLQREYNYQHSHLATSSIRKHATTLSNTCIRCQLIGLLNQDHPRGRTTITMHRNTSSVRDAISFVKWW
ncbi:hypothetical protein A0H81_02176 [Grifola frondosa]|uniref:Uncharacterized protein n=1 Tax=Grifola frondosa TaxID=5627 RepID=A0A1C7MLU7_GRIFR|nr:hypothetical protein A0H81_02176 [Grifola frondosa]